MKTNRIKILHIVRDDKFIDGPLKAFDEDGRFDNQCVMITDTSDYHFKYIQNSERIKLLYNKKMVTECLRHTDYNAIFFFALTDYHIINQIPKDKIVIWWAWGFDIYGPDRFINIPLYKPLTERYLKDVNSSLLLRIKQIFRNLPVYYFFRDGDRREAIRRIDYFQPVIHSEYEMMKNWPGFRAHEFYYPRSRRSITPAILDQSLPSKGGSVLIGNSATTTNNHLDVWSKVNKYIPQGTTVHIPVNYGDTKYADFLALTIHSDKIKVNLIRELLPKEEYFNLLESCGFAIYGVIREQAMANIFRCLATGVKLFLYRDSIVYKYLKDFGCIVFTIDDVDDQSFVTPLTVEQTRHNQKCLIKESEFVSGKREKAIEEIFKVIEQMNR